MNRIKLGPNQKKIILLLLAGVSLGISRSPGQYFRVIKETKSEWDKINYLALRRSIASLYKSKLIKEKENSDGSLTMVLTDKGKQKAITFNIDNMEIKKPNKWDKKWRLLIFDIPEKKRYARDALREVLKRIGFYELQRSVFIFPYQCQSELDFVIEFFNVRPYVRVAIVVDLDNELHLREVFNIS
jgi:DNA-binding transcriptional regulator PaaX